MTATSKGVNIGNKRKKFFSPNEGVTVMVSNRTFLPATKKPLGGGNMSEKKRPVIKNSIREFVNALRKGEFPIQYDLIGTVKYRYRLVAWSKDRIVLNISRFVPPNERQGRKKGKWQSFNVDVQKLPFVGKDFIRFARLCEKIGIVEKGTVVEVLEDLKYEL